MLYLRLRLFCRVWRGDLFAEKLMVCVTRVRRQRLMAQDQRHRKKSKRKKRKHRDIRLIYRRWLVSL